MRFHRVGGPDVAAGRHDDALHFAELAAEIIAFGRRERLAARIKQRDGVVAREAGHPGLVMGVDGEAETGAQQAAAGEAGDGRRERRAVGGELREAAPPEGVLVLGADHEIIDDPGVALAVEHELAAAAQASAGELERQDPGARSKRQIRHERRGPQSGLARRDRVEMSPTERRPFPG